MHKRRIALLTPLALAAVLAVPYPGGAAPAQDGDAGPGFLTGPNEGDPDDIAVNYLKETKED
jgi:extracellular elastinolytic metalloproteinase